MRQCRTIYLKRRQVRAGLWQYEATLGPMVAQKTRLRFTAFQVGKSRRYNSQWEVQSVEELFPPAVVRKLSSAEALIRAVAATWFNAKAAADRRIHGLQQDD